MAATPRDVQPVSLLFNSPSPARPGGVEAAPFTQRQPSWGLPAATPVTPSIRFLQPLQAQGRTDGPAARWKSTTTPTECPPIPLASSMFSVRAVACSRTQREKAERVQRRT